jgi:hypothetical protein
VITTAFELDLITITVDELDVEPTKTSISKKMAAMVRLSYKSYSLSICLLIFFVDIMLIPDLEEDGDYDQRGNNQTKVMYTFHH